MLTKYWDGAYIVASTLQNSNIKIEHLVAVSNKVKKLLFIEPDTIAWELGYEESYL